MMQTRRLLIGKAWDEAVGVAVEAAGMREVNKKGGAV